MKRTHTLLLFALFNSFFSFGQFVAKDILAVSPEASVFDPEYNTVLNIVCWKSDDNKLWISGLNPVTHMYMPSDGKGTFVTGDLSPFGGGSSNGPEWMLSSQGTELVYNQTIGGIRYPGVAKQVIGGWECETLFQFPGALYSMATNNYSDSTALFLYETAEGNGLHWVRNTNLNKSYFYPGVTLGFFARGEHQMCCATDKYKKPGFVETENSLPYFTAISEDTIGAPFMWNDPATSTRLFMYRTNNDRMLKIFQEIVPDQWVLYNKFDSPLAIPFQYITSPEPYTCGGKSYISFMASQSGNAKDGLPAQIWIAGANPADSLMRRVSDTNLAVRVDPEPVVFSDSAFIYYTNVITNELATVRYNVRKCNTGLSNVYTSVPDPKATNTEISAYPNPSAGLVNISCPIQNATGPSKVTIIDNAGKIVDYLEVNASTFQLNLGSLPPGHYNLLIINGHQRFTKDILLAR